MSIQFSAPNFGGGATTATASDVLKDKTAYDSNGKLIIGSMINNGSWPDADKVTFENSKIYMYKTSGYTDGGLGASGSIFGNASTSDVKSGVTFTSQNGLKLTGTASLSTSARLTKLTSGSWSGDAKRSLSVTGYSTYYFMFDDYNNSDAENKEKSQGSWGLVINGGGMTIAECINCNPNTTTTFSITYWHTGGYGRSASVYVIK